MNTMLQEQREIVEGDTNHKRQEDQTSIKLIDSALDNAFAKLA